VESSPGVVRRQGVSLESCADACAKVSSIKHDDNENVVDYLLVLDDATYTIED
jgi:hypothetical protein